MNQNVNKRKGKKNLLVMLYFNSMILITGSVEVHAQLHAHLILPQWVCWRVRCLCSVPHSMERLHVRLSTTLDKRRVVRAGQNTPSDASVLHCCLCTVCSLQGCTFFREEPSGGGARRRLYRLASTENYVVTRPCQLQTVKSGPAEFYGAINETELPRVNGLISHHDT